MNTPKEGILIAIDGIDGAGKTTQVQLLANAFREAGETVTASKEPTDGPWGRRVRESAQTGRLSLADELHAFIEDRKEHVAGKILPALARGEVVLLDRYFFSTIAYQGARGADIAAVEAEMRAIAPLPDAGFIIDVDPAIAMLRISESRGDVPNEFEKVDYLSSVRRIFGQLAPRFDLHTVNGHNSPELVYKAIVQILVSGALKKKRCAKSYDCDIFYCAFRMNGECSWADLQRDLRQTA